MAAGKGANSLSNQQQLQMQQSVTANAAPPAAADNDYDWILLASGPFTLPALSCSSNSISDEEVEGVGCEHAHSGGCDVQQGHEVRG